MDEKKINDDVKAEMGAIWGIRISDKSFTEGKRANLPSLGYPCGVCSKKNTKIIFAESTVEEESTLKWMELLCKNCNYYTLYTKK